jgi:hypothetical protein
METIKNDIKKEADQPETNLKSSSENSESELKKEPIETVKSETQTKEETEIKKEYDPLLDSFYNEVSIFSFYNILYFPLYILN